MHRRKQFAAMLVGSLVLTAVLVGQASAAVPPQSKAFGKSLAEWMNLYWTWYLGGDQDDHVGHVRFMPIPNGEYDSGSFTADDPGVLIGHADVTLGPGNAFALPVAAWIGETYDPDLEIPDDEFLDDSIFTKTYAVVTIDGKTIMDSTAGPLDEFYYGPMAFDPVIYYDEPTDYGAIGAIWVQGLGFVHQPLSVGEHELSLVSEIIIADFDSGIRFENTWTITVAP